MESSSARQFLSKILAMDPASRQQWLAQQGPDERKTILKRIAERREEIKTRKWEIERQKRAMNQVWREASESLHKAEKGLELVRAEFSSHLEIIYTSPQDALQAVWSAAEEDLEKAQQALIHHPQHFGIMRGFRLGFIPSWARVKALKSLKTFHFKRLWEIYHHLVQIRQYLLKNITEEGHVRAS